MIALAGNKLDLANERQIQTEVGSQSAVFSSPVAQTCVHVSRLQEAKQLADEHGVLFFETSARTNHNVTEVTLFFALRAVVHPVTSWLCCYARVRVIRCSALWRPRCRKRASAGPERAAQRCWLLAVCVVAAVLKLARGGGCVRVCVGWRLCCGS